jgi:phospholipase C
VNQGGPHTAGAAVGDIDGGRMDGFVRVTEQANSRACNPDNPYCAGSTDVMGWHDGREIPLYWGYAKQFVLQDHMFEPNLGWSLPSHLFMVSGWSASCKNPRVAATCEDNLKNPDTDGSGVRESSIPSLSTMPTTTIRRPRTRILAGPT